MPELLRKRWFCLENSISAVNQQTQDVDSGHELLSLDIQLAAKQERRVRPSGNVSRVLN